MHSFESRSLFVQRFEQGINEALGRSAERFSVMTEHMNVIRQPQAQAEFGAYLARKYSSQPPDVIISVLLRSVPGTGTKFALHLPVRPRTRPN